MAFLTPSQRFQFDKDGYVLFPDFVPPEKCDELVEEAQRLVHEFIPEAAPVQFSTRDQEKSTTSYFLDSDNKISFFFESDAFKANGELKQPKHLSINKIGHALHKLNPIFNAFSDNDALNQLSLDL